MASIEAERDAAHPTVINIRSQELSGKRSTLLKRGAGAINNGQHLSSQIRCVAKG